MTVEAETKQGKADIRITDRISEWSEASAASVRAKVDEMTIAGITEANVYINSKGGDVFQANEIINELKKFKTVSITVGSLAASAATRILAEFNKSAVAFKNSQFMIHKPAAYLDGNEDEIESELRMLKNITSDYKSAYAECSGKTEDEIEELWKSGDHWMTASEALEFGLIGSIKDQKQKPTPQDIALLEACGAPNVPTAETEPGLNNQKMDKDKLKSLLGLAADATDEQIEKAIAENKQKAAASAQMESVLKAQADERAEALVNDAILKGKKITADQKENWLALAKANYDGTKAALDAMPEIGKVSAQISAGGHAEARKNWTLNDYLEKDPEAYEKLKVENPEAAAELENSYFKK